MSRQKRLLVLLGFFILLAAAFMIFYFAEWKDRPKALPMVGEPGHKVQPFSFTDQLGRPYNSDSLKGKIYAVNFFFATCKGICPRMNENFSKVYEAYRGDTAVVFLSHTVNPELDTPAALAAYARRFEADPGRWVFLTGDKQALYDQARYSYLLSAADDTTGLSIDDDFIHDQHFVLVDRNGNMRGKFYDGLDSADVQQLIKDIKVLEQEK